MIAFSFAKGVKMITKPLSVLPLFHANMTLFLSFVCEKNTFHFFNQAEMYHFLQVISQRYSDSIFIKTYLYIFPLLIRKLVLKCSNEIFTIHLENRRKAHIHMVMFRVHSSPLKHLPQKIRHDEITNVQNIKIYIGGWSVNNRA